MSNFDISKIKSNEPVIAIEIIDCSGSMDEYVNNMRKALSEHKDEMLNLDEVNGILFQRVNFNTQINLGEYLHMSEFSTSYSCGGGTALYAAIYYAGREFFKSDGIYEKFIEEGKNPSVVFIVFSDGEDNSSSEKSISEYEAREMVEKFNEIGATTAFVAFDQGESIGRNLKFQSVKSYSESKGLETAFRQISRSVRKVSTSKVALGNNFFDDV